MALKEDPSIEARRVHLYVGRSPVRGYARLCFTPAGGEGGIPFWCDVTVDELVEKVMANSSTAGDIDAEMRALISGE